MNTTLTDDDKARIEAEERYRAEIRAKLENTPNSEPIQAEAEKRYQAELQIIANRTSRDSERNGTTRKAQEEIEERRRVVGGFTWTVLSFLGAFIAIVVLLPKSTHSPANAAQEAKTDQRFEFAVACERLAKNQLKSPSTAEFTDASQQQQEISSTTTGLTWDGWVDSENSFGAKLRSYFTCDFTEASDKVNVTFTR